jgi:hypothetical protein
MRRILPRAQREDLLEKNNGTFRINGGVVQYKAIEIGG